MQEVRVQISVPPHQLSASLEPKSIPIPRLKSKNGKGFPEDGEVGAGGLWFRRASREAKKDCLVRSSSFEMSEDDIWIDGVLQTLHLGRGGKQMCTVKSMKI